MLVRDDGECFLKEATSLEEDRSLKTEATILRAARHPGVVRLIGLEAADSGRTRLRLARVDGASLDRVDGLPVSRADALSIGSALASLVADIHDIGVVHGSIEPSHVIVGRPPNVVLCGFSRGGLLDGSAGREARAQDVAATAALVEELLRRAPGPIADRRVDRALARAPRQPARRLARTLSDSAHRPARFSRRLPIAGAALSAAFAAWLSVAHMRATDAGRSVGRTRAPCPAVDQGCRPMSNLDGELRMPFGRFRVSEPGDLAVIGRWTCSSTPDLAVLRPASGQVFSWDTWPDSGEVTARLVKTVPGATSLHVLPAAGGCDHLVVDRTHGPSLDVDLRSIR